MKWFNPMKGFGFITPQDGGPDVFVHATAAERAGLGHLQENQKLGYDLERGQNGKVAAINLQVL